jgi:hypothetical protein
MDEVQRIKNDRLTAVPDALVNALNKANNESARQIIKAINNLEVENGFILINSKNSSIISQIDALLESLFIGEAQKKALTTFVNEFEVQANYSIQLIFAQTGELITPTATQTIILNTARRTAVSSIIDSTRFSLINPIKAAINNSLSSGAATKNLVNTILLLTNGNSTQDPKAQRYVRQIAHDSFAMADRAYMQESTASLDAEFYQYVGGEVKDTRPFCEKYKEQFFHKKEIENFGRGIDLDGSSLSETMLEGRMPNTNAQTIFVQCGGYNCKHTYVIASTVSVPKSVIQRAMDKGFFRPSESERKLLNL